MDGRLVSWYRVSNTGLHDQHPDRLSQPVFTTETHRLVGYAKVKVGVLLYQLSACEDLWWDIVGRWQPKTSIEICDLPDLAMRSRDE